MLCGKFHHSLSRTLLVKLFAMILVGFITDADAVRHRMQVFMKG